MSFRTITSKQNRVARLVRLVSAQARRAPADLVLAEGLRVLEEATRSPCAVVQVVMAEGYGSAPREEALIAEWSRKGIPIYMTSAKLLATLSDVVAPQGAVALVRIQRRRLVDAGAAGPVLAVCACDIQDPGNLGTLVRSARAARVSLFCTTAGTASLRNPKTIRASAGALFHQPFVEDLSPEEFVDHCSRRSIPVFRTSAEAGLSIWNTDLKKPCAILLGNESRGIEDPLLQQLPNIRIPMAPGVDSLNVAVAGSIILFEALRQRSSPNLKLPLVAS